VGIKDYPWSYSRKEHLFFLGKKGREGLPWQLNFWTDFWPN